MARPAGKIWLKGRGGVPDIVGMIASVDASLKGDTKQLAGKYRRNEQGLKEFYGYVVREVAYKADGPEKEVIKYPSRTLRDKKGDCKSMSILIGSFLKDKGIPYIYRFTYTDKNNPLGWHVYPIATINGKQIVMDAVVKQFNKEHPYVAKFDYAPKDIVAVSGVSANIGPSLSTLPKKNFIDPYNWTEGEITAALLFEQVSILNWADPTPEKQAAKALIQDALFLGVNTTAGLEKIRQIENPELRGALIRANKANTAKNGRPNSVSGPLIPLEDCAIYEPVNAYTDPYTGETYYEQNPEALRCQDHNRWKTILNESLEKSSHHLLYEYEDNPNAATPTVAAKKVMHVGAIDALSDISGISRNNLRLWLRNGVLRKNAEAGAGALQPESTIPALAQASREGIGLPIPVVVAIIAAISSAIAGTLQLISSMKIAEAQRLRQAAQTIGQQNFGPLASDWMGAAQFEQSQAGQNSLLSQDNIIPLAAAAAGAVILSQNI